MRRLRASIGFRHSCAEGAESSCYTHRIIHTKSIIRVELEQQTYADSNIVHEPVTDCPEFKGLLAFRRCLKGHPLYLIASCCGIIPSRSFWMVLEMVRNIPWRLESATKTNGRTEHSNRRAGKTERSIASCGGVHCKRRE